MNSLPPEPPAGWLDEITASEADLTAGRVVDNAPILHRLREAFPDLRAMRDSS